jgi:hypothetical protein
VRDLAPFDGPLLGAVFTDSDSPVEGEAVLERQGGVLDGDHDGELFRNGVDTAISREEEVDFECGGEVE